MRPAAGLGPVLWLILAHIQYHACTVPKVTAARSQPQRLLALAFGTVTLRGIRACFAPGSVSAGSVPVPWKWYATDSQEKGSPLIVLPSMQNDRVNKFDPESVAAMLALDAAMAYHPDPRDGPLHRFSVWAEPHVIIGLRTGRAVAYTRSYGLIRMYDEDGNAALEWHPAGIIKRVISST